MKKFIAAIIAVFYSNLAFSILLPPGGRYEKVLFIPEDLNGIIKMVSGTDSLSFLVSNIAKEEIGEEYENFLFHQLDSFTTQKLNFPQITEISYDNAKELHDFISNHPILNENLPELKTKTGRFSQGLCSVRALAVSLEANAWGIDDNSMIRLWAIKRSQDIDSTWNFHTAIAIKANANEGNSFWVIDPLFEEGPMSVEDWSKVVKSNNNFSNYRNLTPLILGTNYQRFNLERREVTLANMLNGKIDLKRIDRGGVLEDVIKLHQNRLIQRGYANTLNCKQLIQFLL